MSKSVKISTGTVGQSHGTIGIVRSVKNGRKLHETRVFPLNHTGPAYDAAKSFAESKGYRVIE